MKPFVDIYAPKNLKDVVGQDDPVFQLKAVVNEKGVALLHGATGTGKTCSVYALAKDLGYEILELNASDFRDSENINLIVGQSLQQTSLFSKGKIVLVDELDGISGSKDRGGLQELNKLLGERNHAVVLVANDPWDKKFSAIRKKCRMIEYKKVSAESIAKILKRICEKEGVHYLEEDLKTLGRRSGGDVRAAMNDLQVLCAGTNELKSEDFSVLGEREQEESVFTGLRVILKGRDIKQSMEVMDNIDVDLDEMMLWLEENIGREYKGGDLVKGYDILGKADVFSGRIRKWQYWRFLVYKRILMGAGVSVAKDREYYGYTPYKRYGRILKIWMSNQKNKRKKDISRKIGAATHVSTKETMKNVVPFVKKMYENNVNINIHFTEEEIEWLSAK